mgnify:CR=1 FL=1
MVNPVAIRYNCKVILARLDMLRDRIIRLLWWLSAVGVWLVIYNIFNGAGTGIVVLIMGWCRAKLNEKYKIKISKPTISVFAITTTMFIVYFFIVFVISIFEWRNQLVLTIFNPNVWLVLLLIMYSIVMILDIMTCESVRGDTMTE